MTISQSLFYWLHREDGRNCGGLRSLRSLRTLPTFPAWSSTTCLRRARFPCPRVDTPPQSLSSSLLKIQYDNTAILLIIKGGGGRVSLDGVAARGLVNGRGPRRSRGRDEVGTRSDETKPDLPCRHCLHVHINTKGVDYLLVNSP